MVMWVFTSDVRKVEGFVFLIMFCTSSAEITGEQFRGPEMADVGRTAWERGPERVERMWAIRL